MHIWDTLYERYHFFGPPSTVKEMTRETRAYRTYRTYYALILAKRPSSEFFSQEIVSVKARSRDHMAVLVYKALTRPASTVPGWRLSALDRHRPPITAVGSCLDVCHKKNTDASRRQEFFRRWTVSLELSVCYIKWQRHLIVLLVLLRTQ